MTDPVIQRGNLLIYRLFDVAEEIKLTDAVMKGPRGRERFNVAKYIDRSLQIKNPPLMFSMGERKIIISGREVPCEVLLKVRDFGVISIIFQIPIKPGTPWTELVALAAELEEGLEIDLRAKEILPEVIEAIRPALIKESQSEIFEDYIIYYIEEFAQPLNLAELGKQVDIPSLLIAEHEVALSETSRKIATEYVFQYGENDLAVVEWNSALVVDPTGGREIPDILEFAVSHLLEMRVYDDLLDERLDSLYNKIENENRRFYQSSGRFDRVYKEASARFIEFTEIIERVENSLKVVGDFYLATVYRAATRKFRMADWQQSVTRKINILGQVSSLLQGEVNYRRSHLLEAIVVVLIFYEIVSRFFMPHG
jgi:hypothetical protein